MRYVLYYHSVTSSSFWAHNPWASSISYALDLYCGFTNPNIQCSKVTLYRPDGSSVSFSGNHATFGSFPEVGGGGLATLVHSANGTWTLHDEDSNILTFDANGYFTSIKDVSGVGWTISTTQTTNALVPETLPPIHPCAVPAGTVHTLCIGPKPPPPPPTTVTTTVVTHTDGQSFKVIEVVKNAGTVDVTGSVTVTDPAGNQYSYSLDFFDLPDSGGLGVEDIRSLTFPGSPATTMTFGYGGSDASLSSVAYNGTPYWTTSYDSDGRVNSDGAADGSEQTSIVYNTTSNGMVATITNPLGLSTANTYVANAQGYYDLVSVSNTAVQGCGATTNTLAWDANDNLTKTVDNDGISHTYDYAANGQLQTETAGAGTAIARTINYTWDPDQQLNRLLSATIPGESRVSYGYDAQNRLASVSRTNLAAVGTPNETLATTYAYSLYGDGTVETMTVTRPSPNGSAKTTYRYDAHGNTVSVTDALGHATAFSNYNALGEVGKIVGPNGAETDYTYDARGRVASKTTHPNGGVATWTYTYDGFGTLAKVTAPDGEVTTWTRDPEIRVTQITHNDKDGTSTETFGYDAAGNVTSDVVARGSEIGKATSYIYNALGRVYQVKGSNGQVLTYGYDGNGNVLAVTDALGDAMRYTYDALNRVASTTNAAHGVTLYTYDTAGHVTHVTDPRGLVTGFAWDGLDQLWQRHSPDTGTTNYGYDAYGRLSSFIRADGTQTYLGYDSLNRRISETADGRTRTYAWDSCTGGIGRLCAAAVSGQSSVEYSYTPQGQIAARAFSITNGPVYTLGYGYDNMGHIAEVQYPDGNEALYDYSHGAVSDVRLKVGSYNVNGVTGVTYQPMDLGMSGWTSHNGLSNTLGYDGDARLTAITVPGVESLAFSYDAGNRITHIANGIDNSLTQSLGYDSLGRLTSVASGAQNATYGYDADGNRVTQTLNGAATNFAYAASSNQLASASGGINATYGYNADGNTTTVDGLAAYAYGPFNRLINAGGADFVISAEGQRLEKSGGGNTTYFAPGGGGTMLAEDLNGTWRDYVWLNGRLVTVVANGGVFPVATDQTGRPVAMTAPNSHAVIWAAAGMPFDRQVTQNNWGEFNVGFPGQYFDSEDGLYQNGVRDYDAALGRYIESDPIGLAGGVNTFTYVGNDPLNYIDPLGTCKHHYQITVYTPCSAAQAFHTLEEPNMSAPGAPQAHTGFTSPITLGGNNGHNQISQYVNPSTMTIINTALPGHQFFPGSVTMHVTPGPFGIGSVLSITGEGNGADPLFNDAVGYAYFGGVTATSVIANCDDFGGGGLL